MNTNTHLVLTRAQESRAAIERLYITMRHLFNRGYYKPSKVSGEEMRRALLTLRPEIYGSVNDPQKVELDGLVYVMDRLPRGIESCRFITLTSQEGYASSSFPVLVPAKRRRNCYRVDEEQMVVEVTNGRSEIYDILTHLTFMFMEADKIRKHAFHERGGMTREWEKLEAIIQSGGKVDDDERELALTYVSTILGRTFAETEKAYRRFLENPTTNTGLFQIVYGLGKTSHREEAKNQDREISFTPTLRERVGHHLYGERWASHIKRYLLTQGLHERPLALRKQVAAYATENGLHELEDLSGTSIAVQLIDTAKLNLRKLPLELSFNPEYVKEQQPVILVMDYAFGEQAFETMDEVAQTLLRRRHPVPDERCLGLYHGQGGHSHRRQGRHHDSYLPHF